VEAVKAEVLTDGHELVYETVGDPKVGIVGGLRAAAPKLVVADDLAAIGEVLEGVQVLHREAGPAVQGEERDATLTDAAIEDLPAGNLDVALVDLRHGRLPPSIVVEANLPLSRLVVTPFPENARVRSPQNDLRVREALRIDVYAVSDDGLVRKPIE